MENMVRKKVLGRTIGLTLVAVLVICLPNAFAAPVPGGTLDPMTIPKYVQPLVIPPEMPVSTVQPTPPGGDAPTALATDYNIAVRQFKQQILPGGVWNMVNGRTDSFDATTVWSYGLAEDKPAADYVAPRPLAEDGATHNYPAFTIEQTSNVPASVRWINDLVDAEGNYLPHLLPVDQTMHWTNPGGSLAESRCIDTARVKDCASLNPNFYDGPVPMVVHVHGAHVNAQSDGYPEAWWLPAANDIPAGFETKGTLYTQNFHGDTAPSNDIPGSAVYTYENTQPASTIWYHDHSLGITRLNVYAGPAGFYLIRGGAYDGATTAGKKPAVLPGPAARGMADPNFNATTRKAIRDIPIAIQDRSFNADGSLFYPDARNFFDGFNGPYVGTGDSDIAPIWNPEAFFNTMVVNGTTWPKLDVAPATYRFRLLNGCNSRFINLAMFVVDKTTGDLTPTEVPFVQIGGDQGFFKNPVEIRTGFATALDGSGTPPNALMPLPSPEQALLMAPAERMDVLVDFSGFADGTIIRMINTAPDAPFGGFPDVPADPGTTGQVMQFVVNSAKIVPADATTTNPYALRMVAEPKIKGKVSVRRNLSLNEEESLQVCVQPQPDGSLITKKTYPTPNPNIAADCAALGAVPQAPKAALLGLIGKDRLTPGKPLIGMPMLWHDPITENPQLGATEDWNFYNLTVDGHPVHMHLVRFNIKNRQLFDPISPDLAKIGAAMEPLPNEVGYKDTVLTYPGEITKVRATFDLPGLYVWHCHILEHEDNEMMRPYYVGQKPAGFPVP